MKVRLHVRNDYGASLIVQRQCKYFQQTDTTRTTTRYTMGSLVRRLVVRNRGVCLRKKNVSFQRHILTTY